MKARLSLCFLLSLLSPPAAAWKPITHVYLAQKAWEDAQDGRVTLRTVLRDPARGRQWAGCPLGEYRVRDDLLQAIRRHPQLFLAGAIGPDAYPDIVTGQMRIHPPGGPYTGADSNPHGAGTDPWLQQIWDRAHTSERSEPNMAFAAGFLTHAAGDIYAHTLINTFAGGIFQIVPGTAQVPNAAKHLVMEGYIGQRTPDLLPVNGANAFDALLPGPDDALRGFIARATAILSTPPESPQEAHKPLSLPWIFSDLREQLRREVAAYEAEEARLRAAMERAPQVLHWASKHPHLTQARACGADVCPEWPYNGANCPPEYIRPAPPSPQTAAVCAGVGLPPYLAALGAQVASAAHAWKQYKLAPQIRFGQPSPREVEAQHKRNQIHNIDDGLREWVHIGHQAGAALFFNRDQRTDFARARELYQGFASSRLIPMLTGLPPQAVPIHQAVTALPHAFQRAVLARHETRTDTLWDLLFLTATGQTVSQLGDSLIGPHAVLEQLFAGNPAAGLPALGLGRMNRIMGLALADASDLLAGRRDAVFWAGPDGGTACGQQDREAFPAAYNTVTLIKLLLLAPEEVNRLLGELQVPHRLGSTGAGPPNVLLGFLKSIDGSHGWARKFDGDPAYHSPGMVLARSCSAYARLFFDQRPRGEGGEPARLAPPPGATEPTEAQACGGAFWGSPLLLPSVPAPININGIMKVR